MLPVFPLYSLGPEMMVACATQLTRRDRPTDGELLSTLVPLLPSPARRQVGLRLIGLERYFAHTHLSTQYERSSQATRAALDSMMLQAHRYAKFAVKSILRAIQAEAPQLRFATWVSSFLRSMCNPDDP